MEARRQKFRASQSRHRRIARIPGDPVFGRRGIVVAVIAPLSRRDSRQPENVTATIHTHDPIRSEDTHMAEKMTRGQIQDLVGKFAQENPKYRQALLTNPKGTIEKQLNTSLGSVSVKAVADTADTVHVVIPYAAKEGELSDADLERVAGGKQDITANCLVLGGTAVSNTVMQLNL
jgi:hypothetical protein